MKRNILFLFVLFCAVAVCANSPYINKVYAFRPGMGQFVNVYPECADGDTEETMLAKVDSALSDNHKVMISLGGWGGYVIFGFDHEVVNVPGDSDFVVLGNAFDNSAEPGVVCVSYDANHNGEPDDAWYELAGSEYNNPKTNHYYTKTYSRAADTTRNAFHTQPYYPEWLQEDSFIVSGELLPDIVEVNGGTYYRKSFAYGYADNVANTASAAKLNIDWAVDEYGKSVALNGIHFVKVYTGVDAIHGRLGESSTEVIGAEDLHPDASPRTALKETDQDQYTAKIVRNGQMYIVRGDRIYNVLGLAY